MAAAKAKSEAGEGEFRKKSCGKNRLGCNLPIA